MKSRFLSILILNVIFLNLFGQQKEFKSFSFFAKPDSIIQETNYGYIYTTTDTSSKYYDWLRPDPSEASLLYIFNEFKNYIKIQYHQQIINHQINEIPKTWNEVYYFNHQYFLYAPSDWISNSGYYISDSIVYIVKSDPYDLYVIRETNLTNKDSVQLDIINYEGNEIKITIEKINTTFGIYLWTFYNNLGEKISYHLMQDHRYCKKLPMIVCDCGKQKCWLEFKFDLLSYEEIRDLKKKN